MNTVTVDIDREIHAPVETSRRTLLSALTSLGFTIERAQGTTVRAQRGSAWLGGLRPAKRPVTVDGTLLGDEHQTTMHLHLAGNDQFASDPRYSVGQYLPLFQAVHDTVDSWLVALDPTTATAPLPSPEVRRGAATPHTVASAARHLGAKQLATRIEPEAWVWVVTPDAAAPLSMNDAQMCLAVASMITASPGMLPPAMMQQIIRLTFALQRGIETATPPWVRVDIDPADAKVVELLFKQTRIRQSLPVREIHRCRDCSFEKVVNPDYQNRARRNRRISDLMGMVGISIGRNPQVFALAGRLLNMKMLVPPEFVCARCQGTDADVALVTLCPQCHTIRREPLLLRCSTEGCGYDFRSRAAHDSPWQPLQPVPLTADPPEPALASPGWYPDPSHRHEFRWFESDWTDHAADSGVVIEDPLEATCAGEEHR